MKWIYHLRIRQQLVLGFGILLGLMVLAGAAGIYSSDRIFNNLESIFAKQMPSNNYILKVELNIHRMVGAERAMIYSNPKSDVFQSLVADYDNAKNELESNWSQYKALASTEEELARIAEIETSYAAWLELSTQVVEGRKANTRQGRRLALDLSVGQERERFDVVRIQLENLTTLIQQYAGESHKGSVTTYNTVMYSLVILVAVSVLVGLLLGWVISNYIARMLRNLVNRIQSLNAGDLETRLDQNDPNELGTLSRAIDDFAHSLEEEVVAAFQKLAEGDFTFQAKGVIAAPLKQTNHSLALLISEVKRISNQIQADARELSGASNSLSESTASQAAALEQIASSVENLNNQTQSNADNVTQANRLAISSKGEAEHGTEEMNNMVTAMTKINAASENISKIIKTIDEISFQTNLLAINAAVEAARAGEHGKGFAVVAEEVRNLAGRSAEAAQETTAMIEDSIQKVNDGAKVSQETAESLSKIVSQIVKVTDLVGDIEAANKEQATGFREINQGLVQINTGTQENVRVSQETANASDKLTSEAEALNRSVAHFKLENARGIHPPQAFVPTANAPAIASPTSESPASVPQITF